MTPGDIEGVGRFGRGTLTIEEFELRPGKDGCPGIAWMRFAVRVRRSVC